MTTTQDARREAFEENIMRTYRVSITNDKHHGYGAFQEQWEGFKAAIDYMLAKLGGEEAECMIAEIINEYLVCESLDDGSLFVTARHTLAAIRERLSEEKGK